MKALILVVLLLSLFLVNAGPVNWTESEPYPLEGISNPYDIQDLNQLNEFRERGLWHAMNYPVEVTGVLLPYKAVREFVDGTSSNFFRRGIERIFQKVFKVGSFDELSAWLGLHKYPEKQGSGPYYIPGAASPHIDHRMGVSLINKHNVNGFTYGCATCHVGNLFGKSVMGLTNRFPRANHFFIRGKKALNLAPPAMFKAATGASDGEYKLYKQSYKRIKSVGARKPVYLGLDTSLAHVALSLAHRNKDEYASFNEKLEKKPRKEKLRSFNSDSKPAVWWNVKYKNRWLLDGSVISGNPILTNLLWNEIGRGTDLRELESWLQKNEQVIKDLTTAVFLSEAPSYFDFFSAEGFDIRAAQRGQAVYNLRCAKCHGQYHKGWDVEGSELWPKVDRLKTVKVEYFEQTPVKNVGTDPLRAQGMESLLQLNDLKISKNNGIKIKLQKGYVPPPLVGIWARWPYFHNNSVPNLCALLSLEKQRPKTYWSGPANNPESDFDSECVGYPLGEKTPIKWKENPEYFFDTSKSGLSSMGHTENILIKGRRVLINESEKMDLIQFLKTL